MRTAGPERPESTRLRLACFGALALTLGALALWRAWCVLSGPDVDTDAYAHHMIARAILADPRDLAVHWVWLPLFHYAQVPIVALGGTMDVVRFINVGLATALPVVLFRYLRRTSPPDDVMPPDVVALVGSTIAAACPIAMQMGTTGQPEPLFALLVLAVAVAFQERRYGATSLFLGAAVMLRYEAWAVLLAVGAILVLEAGRLRPVVAYRTWRAWVVIALPVSLILIWAALRRPVDGRWFGFLRDTRSFANDALHQTSAWDRGPVGLARDVLYYPLAVPLRVLGPALILVPFGVARTWRSQGGRFVCVFLAALAFVSFTWVMRSSLGLDRHFVCIVPLYATFAAQGLATLVRFGAVYRSASATRVRRLAAAAIAAGVLAGLGLELGVWMGHWRASIVRSWPDRREVGAYLRAIPGAPTVFCDEATVEILSQLDRRRFDRHWLDDPHTWDIVSAEARASGGAVYVATWRRKLRGHEGEGEIVLHSVEPGADASRDDEGLAIMRVLPPGPVARP